MLVGVGLVEVITNFLFSFSMVYDVHVDSPGISFCCLLKGRCTVCLWFQSLL